MFKKLSLNVWEFKVFVLCCSLLTFKVLLMAVLIGITRLRKQIFISPEDTHKRGKVAYDDPDIERLRRAHLNDLENIPFFFAIGSCYLLTEPRPLVAALLFLMFTSSRLAHTYVYAIRVLPQPARKISFQIGYIINLYMCIQTILSVILK